MVESYRLQGMPRPLRVDDFPGWGDTCDITGGLTGLAYDLSAVQVPPLKARLCRVNSNPENLTVRPINGCSSLRF